MGNLDPRVFKAGIDGLRSKALELRDEADRLGKNKGYSGDRRGTRT